MFDGRFMFLFVVLEHSREEGVITRIEVYNTLLLYIKVVCYVVAPLIFFSQNTFKNSQLFKPNYNQFESTKPTSKFIKKNVYASYHTPTLMDWDSSKKYLLYRI